jgi:hypothetical protein
MATGALPAIKGLEADKFYYVIRTTRDKQLGRDFTGPFVKAFCPDDGERTGFDNIHQARRVAASSRATADQFAIFKGDVLKGWDQKTVKLEEHLRSQNVTFTKRPYWFRPAKGSEAQRPDVWTNSRGSRVLSGSYPFLV